MESGLLDAAGWALLFVLDSFRLLSLAAGVLVGLFLGIIQGTDETRSRAELK